MKLSISLPSLYPDCLDRALRNIRDATRCDYEVIVVSPTEPTGYARVTWVEERAGTGTGCNAGHAAALEHMTGEFVTPWVDDHLYVDGWDVLALAAYEDREARFHAQVKAKKPFSLGLRHLWPHHVGSLFGIFYPYFPLIRRAYLKRVGWFDPAFKQGFADGDLALRVWSTGGRCEWADRGLIVVHHDDDRKAGVMFDPADLTLFVARWAARYGAGWDVANLRGFNLDVEPNEFPNLVEDNSIYRNEPGFRDLALAGGWRS